MVVIRVRETYDLHTVKNKLTLIGIHTPDPSIVRKQFPGLLMQNKYYRPLSCNVVIASAQRLPADIRSVGTTAEQVSPEDVFNPLLYRACTNDSLSTIEQRLLAFRQQGGPAQSVNGPSVDADNDTVVPTNDDFNAYYGFLANTHGWRTAHPQRGLMMKGLKPLVYNRLYNYAENPADTHGDSQDTNPIMSANGTTVRNIGSEVIRGKPQRLPRVNTTVTVRDTTQTGDPILGRGSGFPDSPNNAQVGVPYIRCMVACILVPPSRLWELYYRMTVEWTIQLSGLRNMSDVVTWNGISTIGQETYKRDYDYGASNSKSIMEQSTAMVDTNVSIEKVM